MKPEVVFQQVRPAGPRVVAMLGDGFAVPDISGEWEVVARPKRKAFTTWNGYGPVKMSLPIVLDGLARDRSVEAEISTLYAMMRNVKADIYEPPVVRISGPVPYTQLQWVVEKLSPGQELRRSGDGQRVRAFIDVSLVEYVPADVAVTAKASPAKAAQERSASAGTAARTYRVKAGDTLSHIALKYLGSANEWRRIADLNGVRDPRRLQIGQVLRIPS